MDDAEALTAILQDPEIAWWNYSVSFPFTRDDAIDYLQQRLAADDTGMSFGWAVEERASGELVGNVDLDFVPAYHRGEIGYWIGSAFRGKGYATEAASRVISWGFESAGLYRIQATYLTGNDESAAVHQKIGMRPEATLRGFGVRDGERFDIHMAAVLRDDSAWHRSLNQRLHSG
jgi:RimJ/RimL family protein N-acetyltransferase